MDISSQQHMKSEPTANMSGHGPNHPAPTTTGKVQHSLFQSSFARSLSFSQSQSLDFELSVRIAAGDPAAEEEAADLSTSSGDADVDADSTITSSKPDTDTETSISPLSTPSSSPTPPPSSSSPPTVDLLLAAHNQLGIAAGPCTGTAATVHNNTGNTQPLLTPKQKNGRIYLPSSTPKRRYTTLNTMRSQQTQDMNKSGGVSAEIEVLRLRKECQSLIEDNRRLISATDRSCLSHHQLQQLHTTADRRFQTSSATSARSGRGRLGGSGGHNTSISTAQTTNSNVETVALQTQIDTLQWQLKQVESSRQMYHAVMEEVVRFLERCYHTLNASAAAAAASGKQPHQHQPTMLRSKSVNQVFVPGDTSSLLNEPFRARPRTSLSTTALVQHIRSHGVSGNGKRSFNPPAQQLTMLGSLDEQRHTGDKVTGRQSESCANLKDLTWRRNAKPNPATLATAAAHSAAAADSAKLSQEAFRLLRTAQNLLSLKEPALAEPTAATNLSMSSTATLVATNADDTLRCPSSASAANSSAAAIQRKAKSRSDNRIAMHISIGSTDDSVHSSSEAADEHDERSGAPAKPAAAAAAGHRPFCLQSSASTVSSSSSGSSVSSYHQLLAAHHQPAAANRLKAMMTPSSAPSSADDESGFSSMSSFQDVGLPLQPPPPPPPATFNHHNNNPAPHLPPRSRMSTSSMLSAASNVDDTLQNNGSNVGEAATGSSSHSIWSSHTQPTPARAPLEWSSVPAPPIPPKRTLSTFDSSRSGDSGEPLTVLWV